MFYLLAPVTEDRDALISHLRSQDICATFHYVPLHSSEAGRKYGKAGADCPVTEDVSARLVRLPFFTSMERELQSRVVEAIQEFLR